MLISIDNIPLPQKQFGLVFETLEWFSLQDHNLRGFLTSGWPRWNDLRRNVYPRLGIF